MTMRRALIALLALTSIIATPVQAGSRFLSIAARGQGQTFGIVTRPADFAFTPPFAIWRKADGSYAHDFDPLTRKPVATVTIYVGAGGNNANDCLSWANRCRGLRQGIARANSKTLGTVVRLLAQVGVYKTSSVDGSSLEDSFTGVAVSRDMIIEPCDSSGNPVATGQIVSIHDQVLGTWTLESGSVYSVPYNNTTEIPNDSGWDASHLGDEGRPVPLMSIHTSMVVGGSAPYSGDPVGAVNYVAGLYGRGAIYRDTTAKKLYVRLSDNRAPDGNFTVSRGNGTGSTSRNLNVQGTTNNRRQTFWARNLDLWGGLPLWINGSEATNRSHDVTIVDSFAGYGRNSGFQINTSGTVALVRLKASSPAGDAYPLQLGTDGVVPGSTTNLLDVYELDCSADWVGQQGAPGTDQFTNGSSAHYNVRTVRVNDSYSHISNRIVGDVFNAQSWNLGLKIGPSLTTGLTSSAIEAGIEATGGGPQSAKVWVDGMTFVGPMTYGLQAFNTPDGGGPGGTLYVRNTDETGFPRFVNGGSIEAY